MNLIDVCIDKKVKKVVALSTDKASSPINLYGATKLASDKLFISGNSYVGSNTTSFSVVRYGNVMGSRGSVIPFFLSLNGKKSIPITDHRMTRFMISLDQGVDLVWHALDDMIGGEVYVKKIPSMKVTELAKSLLPDAHHEIVGIRPGEKLHEQMIGADDSPYTYEYSDHYKILPAIFDWNLDALRIKDGKKVEEGFSYTSDNNSLWMTNDELLSWVENNKSFIGKI
jgi:FlaA1/EpsC-like NDP-sugar epimerase